MAGLMEKDYGVGWFDAPESAPAAPGYGSYATMPQPAPPQAERMDPNRMLWAGTLMDIGNAFGNALAGTGASQGNAMRLYGHARDYNNSLDQQALQRAEALRQQKIEAEERALQERLINSQIEKNQASGQAPTERMRNAMAAGLQPGTEQWNQYMLNDEGGFGNSYRGRLIQTVLNGDPSTPEYALAYRSLSQPEIFTDPNTGTTYQRPGMDLAGFSAPSFGGMSSQAPQPMTQAGSTGQPASSQSNSSAIQGATVVGKKDPATTEGERGAAGFYGRMTEAENTLGKVMQENEGFNPANEKDSFGSQIPLVGNYFVSGQYQQYRQAAEDWIRAKLRKESGAAIPPEEMQQEYEIYFPMPGDGPEVIAQKAAARRQAIEAIRTGAGRALDNTMQRSTASEIEVDDETRSILDRY